MYDVDFQNLLDPLSNPLKSFSLSVYPAQLGVVYPVLGSPTSHYFITCYFLLRLARLNVVLISR